MSELNLIQAVNLALGRALAEDARVVVYGEDVGANGGVFRATVDLQARFGDERVFERIRDLQNEPPAVRVA